MEYRRLGNSGLKISELSFGSWVTYSTQVDETLATRLMAMAYEAGVNFFDNAEVYAAGKSEIIMGKSLKALGWGRDTFAVSSKVFWGGERPTQRGLSRKHVFDACHAALKRLQVEYLDMYFCHRPDPETPVEEVVWSMNDLMRQGKIMYWGTSEWPADKIEEAFLIAENLGLVPPTMEQPEYNLFARERFEIEYAPLFKKRKLGSTIWSPLSSGLLTGKYANGVPAGSRATLPGYEWLKDRFQSPEGQEKIKKTQALGLIAKEIGISLPELAIGWCLKNPNVSTVILGASSTEQLQNNLKSLGAKEKLDPGIISKIESVLR